MKKIFSLLLVLVTMLLATSAWAGPDLDACWNFSKAGDYPRAIASGKRAIKAEPRNPGSFYCLSKAYYSSGELKLALPEMQQAERLATGKEDLMYIYNFMGLILDNMGDKEQALQQYNRSLSLARELSNNDQEATALNNVASIFQDLGQLDQALEYFEKSLELRPDDKNAAVYNNIEIGRAHV